MGRERGLEEARDAVVAGDSAWGLFGGFAFEEEGLEFGGSETAVFVLVVESVFGIWGRGGGEKAYRAAVGEFFS